MQHKQDNALEKWGRRRHLLFNCIEKSFFLRTKLIMKDQEEVSLRSCQWSRLKLRLLFYWLNWESLSPPYSNIFIQRRWPSDSEIFLLTKIQFMIFYETKTTQFGRQTNGFWSGRISLISLVTSAECQWILKGCLEVFSSRI